MLYLQLRLLQLLTTLFTLLTMPFPLHYSVLISIAVRAPLAGGRAGSCNPQLADGCVEAEVGEMIDERALKGARPSPSIPTTSRIHQVCSRLRAACLPWDLRDLSVA